MIKREEIFTNRMHRLFPVSDSFMHINGHHTKDITIQVTDECNMACTYCYQHNKGNHVMSFDVAKQFIDMILDADERSNKYITSTESNGVALNFIGGEPLLEIDLIDQITEYFLDQMLERHHPWATRYMIGICTNGLLYFEPKVQEYVKRHWENLSFSVSIDGNKKLHDACRIDLNGNGTYDRAIAGVNHFMKELGGFMGSKMTLAPSNLPYTYEAVRSLIENGYDIVHLNCIFEDVWEKSDAAVLYKQLIQLADYMLESGHCDDTYLSIFDEYSGHAMSENEQQNWCGGIGLMIAVDWKGDIYPCLRYMESSIGGSQKPYIIGNVYDGIMATKDQCDRVNCMACVTRRSQSTDDCYYCPIASGCGWCSALNYEVFGTPDRRTTSLCDMHATRVMATSYYWNSYYRMKGLDKRFSFDIPESWALKYINRDELSKLILLAQKGV